MLVIGSVVLDHFVLQKQVTPRSANQYTKGDQSSSGSSKGNSPLSIAPSSGAKSNSTVSSPLVQPSGGFVSNHHPNLSDLPAPNSIVSVCNTTPGATCQVFFTKDGVQKSLPAQVTDSGGSTYWSWTLQNIGLTTGSWQVKATATLGYQTQSASDVMELVVSP